MIVGIDLGTTNSAVAVWRDGKADLIPNSLGHRLTPSAVSLDEQGTVLVGLPARERQATHPTLTATAFKRLMGSQRVTRLGKRDFLPEELSALVLKALKADAEAYLGQPVTEAVITVPAYFNDKQRKATRRAGELAGLKVERLLNEPTAAALAYGIHQLEAETQFLVFDLGGGTFDVSILEIFEGVIEVRATSGDNRLGGEDFNELIVDDLRQRFAADWGRDTRESDALYQRLRAAAERARRALSEQAATPVRVVWKDKTYEYELTSEAFETRAEGLLNRLREPVLRALRDGQLEARSLREIVLVGGATRMPAVRRAVTRMFGRFPAHSVHPDEAVALGAAVQAGLKGRDAALNEVVITDVCPYSLGVDVAERNPDGSLRTGIFSPILERNTVIPASRVSSFHTLQANQKAVTFTIYQGESRDVQDNVALGQVSIPVPPRPAGAVKVDCRFTYDINGLLEVDVHVPETGEQRNLVITDEEAAKPDDLEARRQALAALKVHPRDTEANRAVLARANRCYEDFLGDKRAYVAHLLAQFEGILEGQEPRAIEAARQSLSEALDQLEGETYL
ncbi:Hsp70 family protein [Nitrospirillum bahiense]|uniref:Molecular chaperone HscC n=1 Tax=Nitrospirillum amazonense TaxID=28077 RepID=A0A560G570_9PROT|nr:molecular chaperone HscC [Nitrospirillum amazonense]TWB29037.1 molecular chaperone HscC [Nitrospirillum amazonense]